MKKDWLNWDPEKGFYWEKWVSSGIIYDMSRVQALRQKMAIHGSDSDYGIRPKAKIMAKLLS